MKLLAPATGAVTCRFDELSVFDGAVLRAIFGGRILGLRDGPRGDKGQHCGNSERIAHRVPLFGGEVERLGQAGKFRARSLVAESRRPNFQCWIGDWFGGRYTGRRRRRAYARCPMGDKN